MSKKQWQLLGAAASIGAAVAEYRRSKRWTTFHTVLVVVGAIASVASVS